MSSPVHHAGEAHSILGRKYVRIKWRAVEKLMPLLLKVRCWSRLMLLMALALMLSAWGEKLRRLSMIMSRCLMELDGVIL